MNYRFVASKTGRINTGAWLLSALFAVLFTLYGVVERRDLLHQAGLDAQQIAGQTALAADGTLDASRQLLKAIKVLASTSKDAPHIRRLLLDWKAENKYVMDLLILSGEGNIQHWTGTDPLPDVKERDYFRAHLQAGKRHLYLGPPLLSKVHLGQWFFALSEDVRDEQGQLQAVVVAIIDIALFKDRLTGFLSSPRNTQILAAPDGTIYTRSPDHDRFVGQQIAEVRPQGIRPEADAGRPFTLTSPLDAQPRIAALSRLPNYPLYAVGTLNLNDVYAPWYQRLAVISTLWLLITAGALWVARRLSADVTLQERLANTDGLTGIPNRRAILSTASQFENAGRLKATLSLLMVDVDHFKQVNDRFGHQSGDAVLRQISDTLRQHCRTTDVVGRYGGEEFLVLMPETAADGAARVAEKLRAAVASLPANPVTVTISIGMATTSAQHPTLQAALSRADKALYAAKAAGRNCLRAAD
jgi:diguanylate cyclase (GGDEF)-like protein